MALYAINYTRTEVRTVFVEADTLEEAKDIDSENYWEKVKTSYEDSTVSVVNSSDEITMTPHSE